MQKCITSRWFEVQANITRIIGFVLCGTFCLLGIVILIANKSNLSEAMAGCLLLVMLGIVANICCAAIYIIDTRTFTLDKDGISVQYADIYDKHYSWSDVSSIVICDVYHSTRTTKIYEHVIRIAIGEEPDGPFSATRQWTLSGHKKWSTYEYGLSHFQTVISISFTSDRLDQVKLLSGKDINYVST